MDEPSVEDKKLDDLKNDDTTQIYNVVSKSCKKHHFFVEKAKTVSCKNCGVGYYITGNFDITNGELQLMD